MQFIASLEFTLREGLPQEKLVALRQCIDRIRINKPAKKINVSVQILPASSLKESIIISQDMEVR